MCVGVKERLLVPKPLHFDLESGGASAGEVRAVRCVRRAVAN